MNKDQLNELIGRLNGVYEDLLDFVNTDYSYQHPTQRTHLIGKAEGVRLALSYVEEITRENHNAPE